MPAQHFNYRLHDENNGLICNELYDVYQDKKGYIWFATACGAVKYAGSSYISILPDSTIKNPVFKIYEDDFGRIWFVANMGNLFYYDVGKEKTFIYKYNKALDSVANLKKKIIIRDFKVLKDSSIMLGTLSSGFFSVSTKGVVTRLPCKKNDVRKDYILQKKDGNYFCCSVRDGSVKNSDRLTVYEDGKEIYAIRSDGLAYSNENCFFIERKNKHVIFTAFGKVVDLYNGKVCDTITEKSNIISIYEDSDSCLWIGYLHGGVKRIPPNKPLSHPQYKVFFQKNAVSKVLEDHEHGFWFTTLYNGALYVPNTHLENLEASDLSIDREKYRSMASDGRSKVFAGTEKGEVRTYEDGKLISVVVPSGNSQWGERSNRIRTLLYDTVSKGLYVGSDEGVFYIDDKYKVRKLNSYVGNRFFWLGKDFYTVGYSNVSKNLVADEKKMIRNRGKAIKLLTAYVDSRRRAWIGTATGLYTLEGDMLIEQPDPLLSGEIINDIVEVSGDLFIATGKGLAKKNDKASEQVFIHKDIAGKPILKLYNQNDSVLWISTRLGFYKYNLREKKVEFVLDKRKGLFNNTVNDFLLLKDNAYILSFYGISYFNIKTVFKNNNGPKVYISDVVVDSVSCIHQENPVLEYNSKYININVEGLTFRQGVKKIYTYRLKGYSESWQQSISDNIQFASLPSGSYTFEVKAQNEDGVFSPQPAVFSFSIRKPLWRELWSQLLMLLVIAVVIAAIFYARLKSTKEANKIMEQLSNYKQQALGMQMNPHFIFNSLNSIQAYVLSEKPMKAAKYLAVFSKLMRKSLDNSRKEFIHIEEEVSTLELYLQLESNRAKNLFDFWFEYDKERLKNIMIPPMLIQPHIENAIKHGFRSREGRETGSIKISFVMRNGSLYCFIEDNGIGVNRARSLPEGKTSIHKSAGIDVTRTRLELLCKSHGFDFYFEIKDRSDKVPGESGTVVEFIIPYIYETKGVDS